MTTIIADMGDIHAGSTVAVCPPVFAREDGGSYQASKAQKELYRLWLKYHALVKEAVGGSTRRKKKFYLLVKGEVIDGDHHDTSQLITRNQVTQLKIAHRLFEPFFDLKPDRVFIIRGTPAHSGESSMWDEEFAKDTGAEPDTENGTHSWYWLPAVWEGVRFDIAHHGRAGGRPWTESNGANGLAAQIIFDYVKTGDKPPDLALRGHVHKNPDSGDNFATRVIHTPSWQLQTAFGNRIGPGQILPIGAHIIECDKGQYDIHKVVAYPKRRQPWTEPQQ